MFVVLWRWSVATLGKNALPAQYFWWKNEVVLDPF